MSGQTKMNFALYRELGEPFESAKKFDQALGAFFDDLGELRKKHRLRDVYVIVNVSVATDADGNEGELFASMHYGDSTRSESMAAYAYGRETKERQHLMSELLSGVRFERPNRK